MSFLRVFERIWRGLWPASPNTDPAALSNSDRLSRFLFKSNEFSAEKQIVKRSAFMPARESQTTSVFHTTGLNDADVLAIARLHIVPERKKEPYGWADIQVQSVLNAGLEAHYDNQPPRHVDLRQWPKEKDAQMSVAQMLAAAASLHLLK